ncbi:phage regulatory protein/antirepressor Ant [Lentibacillus amyloliquefaciens]|uniref:Antirepressor protein C-terminal domain-containing protein n=1 Tax=Lentibacillus amyloliquefaciens TaxID=1472767 RepID=A0A0U4FP34_9BACI|nr:phage regulatory protein/antirepressor Ant [Lentibacillus amyloliquefaciens]ALX50430.1 hypothetical protein AOX59_18705 [Lentibacillus amyloliquefaciens]
MNELMTSGVKMTSLDIAEIVEKEHKNVMRDIRNEIRSLGEENSQLIFEQSSYTNSRGKRYECYEFGKDGAMQLALKYDAKTRRKVIKRIDELERGSNKLPGNYKEALIQLVTQVEENEKLETQNNMLTQQNKELRPKADYTDKILKNKGLVTIGQIAKDYGMSAQKMNRELHSLGVQYKQSEQWLLYRKYQDKGYTHSNTVDIVKKDGTPDVRMNTKWTQKGRLFLYELLKEHEIIPVIEQDDAS